MGFDRTTSIVNAVFGLKADAEMVSVLLLTVNLTRACCKCLMLLGLHMKVGKVERRRIRDCTRIVFLHIIHLPVFI
jgi:hypothetical protein